MSDLHNKVIDGLEKVSSSAGYPLEIMVGRDENGERVIQFTSGFASIKTRLSTFVAHPKIVMDPFVEEIIKRNL